MMERSNKNMTHFQAAFDAVSADLPGGALLGAERKAAITRFLSLGLPGKKTEAWRYADLKPLGAQTFMPIVASTPGKAPDDFDETPAANAHIAGLNALAIDVRNGQLAGAWDAGKDLPDGLQIARLSTYLAGCDKDDALYGLITGLHDGDAFDQLNTAMMADGLIIDVADGAEVSLPIEIGYAFQGADGKAAHLRNVIRLGKNASLTFVENFTGDDSAFFTNLLTQINLADGAHLRIARRQAEGTGSIHIARTYARLGKAARLEMTGLSTGAKSARAELRVTFADEGAHVDYRGGQLARDKQVLDTLTHFDHAAPQCTSEQIYRGVLASGAKASFQGKVHVARGAQLTDANQKSDSLLLDRSAEANAKPELEIYADDVKCAHGSTVGELSDDQLFYLMARGLTPDEAKALLVEAFIAELFEGLDDAAVQDAFLGDARHWLSRSHMDAGGKR